jgi:hypothetical protein
MNAYYFPERYFFVSAKPRATSPTKRERILVVNPGRMFPSWIRVGISKKDAAKRRGPLAAPPIPTTIAGLTFKRKKKDWSNEERRRKGNFR